MNPTESFVISTHGLSKTYTDVSQSPLARLAGPIALTAGALMTIQQLVMYTIVDRSHLIATMAHPLFVPSAIGYVVAFCGLLIALVAGWLLYRLGRGPRAAQQLAAPHVEANA